MWYIKNKFRFNNYADELPEEKYGFEWIFWKSGKSIGKDGKKIKELLHFSEGVLKKDDKLPTYYITNEYKNSYHSSKDAASDMKNPFEDATWYATLGQPHKK